MRSRRRLALRQEVSPGFPLPVCLLAPVGGVVCLDEPGRGVLHADPIRAWLTVLNLEGRIFNQLKKLVAVTPSMFFSPILCPPLLEPP